MPWLSERWAIFIAPVKPPLKYVVHARHVERAHLDPGRHVPVAAVGRLGGEHRDVERVAQLPVAAELEFAHRLLVPEEAALLEHAAEPHRRDIVPAGRAVEHEIGVRARPFAQVARELRVLLRVAPGVQLERREADIDALLDVALVLVHRVPGHRGRVGRAPWGCCRPASARAACPPSSILMSQAS